MAQQNDKQKPEAEFRAGLISASVWRNEMQQDGQKVSRYSIRPKKRYRRDDGGYETSEYYFPEDLPKLILVIQKAYEFTTLKERKDLDESVPA
jgi:hypothetical protein